MAIFLETGPLLLILLADGSGGALETERFSTRIQLLAEIAINKHRANRWWIIVPYVPKSTA